MVTEVRRADCVTVIDAARGRWAVTSTRYAIQYCNSCRAGHRHGRLSCYMYMYMLVIRMTRL